MGDNLNFYYSNPIILIRLARQQYEYLCNIFPQCMVLCQSLFIDCVVLAFIIKFSLVSHLTVGLSLNHCTLKISITGVKLSKPHTTYLKWVHSNLFQTCPGLPTNVRIKQSQNPQNVLLYASVLSYNRLISQVQIFANWSKVVSNFSNFVVTHVVTCQRSSREAKRANNTF